MKTILFIHQSAELYGSDKTLLFLAKSIGQYGIRAIVVLPEKGPLADLIRKKDIKLIINPVIKVSRSSISFFNLFKLPFQILFFLYTINKKLGKEKIDIVHSNTLAVLGGAIFAKWKHIRHIWHIHEIIEKPRFINKLYRFLVNSLSYKVVFNSKASLISLVKQSDELNAKSQVIYNGIEKIDKIYSSQEINDFRTKQMKFPADAIIVGMAGRISRWKGQLLLLNAYEKLQKEIPNLYLIIIGSPPPDQGKYLFNLKTEIIFKALENHVRIIPFTTEIWKYWSGIDIAVVPSIEPEPFGLVAIEAMLIKKPVIAAGHGGLLEIIEHKENGLLFEPNNLNDLYASLKLLAENESLRTFLGTNGNLFVSQEFTIDKYVHNFVKLYQNIMDNV